MVSAALFSTQVMGADEPGKVLSANVQRAQESGIEFASYDLFHITTGNKHSQVLSKETLLVPDMQVIAKLYNSNPDAVTINVSSADGNMYSLELLKSNPLAANPNLGYIDQNGMHRQTFDVGVHYQGYVSGKDRSLATMSVFANGEVMMMFASDEGNFVVGKLDDNSGNYVLYNDRDFLQKPPSACGVTDEGLDTDDDHITANKGTAAYDCNKVSLYWEADNVLYKVKSSSATNTIAYMTGTANQVQAMYRNEQIAVELKSAYVWVTDDNYAESSSADALSSFKSRWNGKVNNFEGDLAMLLAYDPGGLGGIAFVDVLCNRNNGYAYGDVNGFFLSIPTYTWDVEMITHEIGHNLGSKHTHWCGWKTGPGGSCGSIDNCVTQEYGSGCSTCPSTYDNAQSPSAWQGTVMSYCHLVSRGTDLANGFGPLPGDKIRTEVSTKSCLSSIISATLKPIDICKNQGAIMLDFDTTSPGSINFGVPQFKYQWSNGASSQNIGNISTPGTFTVTVTDSNGCTKTFTTSVSINNSDSCKTTGVNNVIGEQQYVSLYPNPAGNQVTLKFFSNAAEATVVKVTDLTGRVVKQEQVASVAGENNYNIKISNLRSGLYYVTLQSTSTQYISLKLVKQ